MFELYTHSHCSTYLTGLRRHLGEVSSSAADLEQPSESMEDIITESSARGGNLSSGHFGGDGSASPVSSHNQSLQGLVSPPRPMELRPPSSDVGPRPNIRSRYRFRKFVLSSLITPAKSLSLMKVHYRFHLVCLPVMMMTH